MVHIINPCVGTWSLFFGSQRDVAGGQEVRSDAFLVTWDTFLYFTVSEIELVFYPHPDNQYGDEPRYIKTTDNASIQHLKKYLLQRLQLETKKAEGWSNSDKFITALGPARRQLQFCLPVILNYLQI